MKVFLDEPHYVDDVLLDKGAFVGDDKDCVHDWRYKVDVPQIGAKAGERRPLSRSMSPMNDETRKMLKDAFGTDTGHFDPTAAIPIQGTTRDPGLQQAKSPPIIRKEKL